MTDENNHGSLLFLIGSESTFLFWVYSQRRQQIPGSDLCIQLDGTFQSCQHKRRIVVRHQMFERMVLRSPVEKIGIRGGVRLWIVGVYGFRLDQPLWLPVWQRSEHHRVHHTEN